MQKVYDTVIIGGGPGGYTAALYAARAGLSVLVVERLGAGGQMALTQEIDNYPGFAEGVDGFTLGQDMKKGAERFGAETLTAEVTAVSLKEEIKQLHTTKGILQAKTVIVATGVTPKKLGVPEETELIGAGVSYCGHCDGMFYRGKTVVVVGGGNSAVAEALFLSRLAQKVILVHRRDTLRATKIYHNQLLTAPNVEIRWNSQVIKLLHAERLTGIIIKNTQTGEESEISCQGLFVSVGRNPATDLFSQELELDGNGYIVADETTKTNLPGVYAVGDVRTKELRQIVTATADGAVAAYQVERYLI